jgi:hypothetical protein
MRCLACHPGQRFGSASELAEAVRSVRRSLSRRTSLAPAWLPLAAAALVLLAVGLGIWASLGRKPLEATATAAAQSPAKGDAQGSSSGAAAAPVVRAVRHPDGRELRQDFAINLEAIGGRTDAKGVLHLQENDVLSFRLDSSRDCYVGLCHVDHLGNVVWLFPNGIEQDNLILKDRPRVVPGENKGVIRATVSEGPEYIYLIASTNPWKPRDGQNVIIDGKPFMAAVTDQQRQAFRDQTRGLVLETPKPVAEGEPRVSEQIMHFQVSGR